MLGSGDSELVLMHVTYLAHLLTVFNHTILTCTERVALGESASQKNFAQGEPGNEATWKGSLPYPFV